MWFYVLLYMYKYAFMWFGNRMYIMRKINTNSINTQIIFKLISSRHNILWIACGNSVKNCHF